MTGINKNNIEKWLFDYYEGNLNQEEREALEKFVLLNPEYASEMDAWSEAYVENEEFEYHNTESLYQKKRKIGWIGWSSAAAILITGITLSFLFFSQPAEMNLDLAVEIPNQKKDAFNPSIVSENRIHSTSSNSSNDPIVADENIELTNELNDQNLAMNEGFVHPYKQKNVDQIKKNDANKAVVNLKKMDQKQANLKNQDSNLKMIQNNAKEDLLVVNKSNNSLNQNNISDGQNHIIAQNQKTNLKTDLKSDDIELNNEVVANNKSNDELISVIPGNANNPVVENEFAHLEPVKAEVDKDIILYQALGKLDFDSGNYSGSYDGNPDYSKSSDIDLSANLKNSSRKTTSKFIRDIKRAFNNPSGVTNLRDPNLVIPGFNPIAFNPSLAGGMLKTRIQLSYMNQWTGTSQMQHMGNLSVDSYVYAMRGGIGFNLQFRDFGKGMYRNYDASLIYSPKINFGKFLAIEPSIKFNAGAYTLDRDKVQPGGQIEMERGNIYQTFESGETPIGSQKIYYDLGVGLFVNTKWFYAGFSMDNIFRHKENIFSNDLVDQRRAPYRINAVIGTDFESRNKNFSGSPFIVYQHYDKNNEFYFGSNFRFYWGTAGISVSDKGNISAQAGIQFKKFKMMYQYDWTKSELMGVKGHSHEVMFRFTIKPKRSLAKNLEY